MNSNSNASVHQYGPATPTPTVSIGPPTHQETSLPHTGYDMLPFALFGLVILTVGLTLRQRLRHNETNE